MNRAPLEHRLRARTERLGFTLFGVARAGPADGFDRFAEWLRQGRHGEMAYLAESAELRRHPRSVLPEVRSVVMLGVEYGLNTRTDHDHNTMGRVAGYACYDDYHLPVRRALNELRDWLAAEEPGAVSHGVVDSAPILERDFARRAGLGWVGKNTMLISRERGSAFFLAAFLTSLELTPSEPFAGTFCGTCTACLDACPTAAFVAPGTLDARRCVSYLTIELRGVVPDELAGGVGEWLFGCDVCQEVCPWNRFAGREPSPLLSPRPDLLTLDPVELLALDEDEFRRRFRSSALYRAKRGGLVRSAALVTGNRRDARAVPALRKLIDDPEEGVRTAARWALARIEPVRSDAVGERPV